MGALTCPACGEGLPQRSRRQPRSSKKALLLYVLAGLVAFAGMPAMALGLNEHVAKYLFVLAAGAIALFASRLPKLRSMRCGACGWQEERSLKAR
jgi:hypothetical protein